MASSIVGEALSLEYVSCPSVKGSTVVIGKGCRIDPVEYSESVQISKKAKVGKVKKI